jgi:adenylate cyclase
LEIRRIAPGFLFSLLILTTAILVRAADPPVLSAMRGAGFDTLQRLWPRQLEAPQPVRIVDIDEASLKKLGQWPWPRKKLAMLVDRLGELGAGAIVFDIVFPEPDRVSPRQLIGDPEFRKIASAAGANADILNWPDSDAEFAASFKDKPLLRLMYPSRLVSPKQAKAPWAHRSGYWAQRIIFKYSTKQLRA